MLGNMLTKDEVEDFMREADVVESHFMIFPLDIILICLFLGWKWKTRLWWICQNDAYVLKLILSCIEKYYVFIVIYIQPNKKCALKP